MCVTEVYASGNSHLKAFIKKSSIRIYKCNIHMYIIVEPTYPHAQTHEHKPSLHEHWTGGLTEKAPHDEQSLIKPSIADGIESAMQRHTQTRTCSMYPRALARQREGCGCLDGSSSTGNRGPFWIQDDARASS